MQLPAHITELEDLLSRPTSGVRETLRVLEGDVMILGAGGKMGPTLARMDAWLWDAARSYEWFGPPEVTLEEMMISTAAWVRQGGVTINKPTHFESTEGKF